MGLTEAHCFAASGLVFCEFELPAPAAFTLDGGSLIVAQAIKDMEAAHDLFELADVVARSMRAVSGFERVIVYRFELDGDGEVVGESLAEDWDQSFMGLRFPASDIPPQARALYRVSHQRWIPAGDYDPVPLMPKRNQRGDPLISVSASIAAFPPFIRPISTISAQMAPCPCRFFATERCGASSSAIIAGPTG